jgi:hypothetical protein
MPLKKQAADFMKRCNLKIPKELSFRSAVFSREESAAGSKQIPRR